MSEIEAFVSCCEAALSACLRAGDTPSPQLAEAIAVCKVALLVCVCVCGCVLYALIEQPFHVLSYSRFELICH